MRIRSYSDFRGVRASLSRNSRRLRLTSSIQAPARSGPLGSRSPYVVCTMAWDGSVSLMITSYTVGFPVDFFTPSPEVALAWGSKSQSRTFLPSCVSRLLLYVMSPYIIATSIRQCKVHSTFHVKQFLPRMVDVSRETLRLHWKTIHIIIYHIRTPD